MPGIQDLLAGLMFANSGIGGNPVALSGGLPFGGANEAPMPPLQRDLPPPAMTPDVGAPTAVSRDLGAPSALTPEVPQPPMMQALGTPPPIPGERPMPMPAAGPQGGMMEALGLTPDRLRLISHSLAGGLANMKNSPFAGQAFANGMGGALGGGNKFQDDESERARKDRVQDDLNRYRMGQLGVSQGNLDVSRSNSASLSDYRRRSLDLGRDRLGETTRNNEARTDLGQQRVDSARERNDITRRNNEGRIDVARERNDITRQGNADRTDVARDRNGIQRQGTTDRGEIARERNTITRENNTERNAINRDRMEAQKDRPSAWNKPDRQVELDYERQVSAKEKALRSSIGVDQPGLLPADLDRRSAEMKSQLDAYSKDLRGRLKLPTPQAPAQPYDRGLAKPITRQQYDALQPGELYQHPNDPPGKLRRKGGAPAAAPAPDTEEDDGA